MTKSAAINRLEAAQALLGVSPNTVIAPINEKMRKEELLLWHNKSSISKIPVSSLDGLETLATLATTSLKPNRYSSSVLISGSCSTSYCSSSDEDSEAMPPPPPRRRIRSCSNPEGMERWDSLTCFPDRTGFVLPTCILEEELAEAKAATERKKENDNRTANKPIVVKKRTTYVPVLGERILAEGNKHTDILRRARSRLLEDLSTGSISGQKGELILPHSLAKYKNVYNKNGRIGIYTPAERAAIIKRFQSKRSRRVWNKKIRYSCRKNLADRRLRVKGRFVKQSKIQSSKIISPLASDGEMPDVNDLEAGFSPTPDQPFRRIRRHTIT